MKITYITSNADKLANLQRYLGIDLAYANIDLDEIQSLDLSEVIEHKAKNAYAQIQTPVLVEDASVELTALGKLPGPFIKFFMEELGDEGICRVLDGKDRSAIAECYFGFYDGTNLEIIKGRLNGEIAPNPVGTGGFGWDTIFIPNGHSRTRAELSDEEYAASYRQFRNILGLQELLKTKISL